MYGTKWTQTRHSHNYLTCFIDEDNEYAYWIDDRGLVRAPFIDHDIINEEREHLDFDTISSNVDYYMFIIDKIKAAK